MGMTPISNLTPLLMTRSIEADLEPLPMARVENSARSGDETYSPSNGNAGPSPDDDSAEDDATEDKFEDLADQEGAEPTAHTAAKSLDRQISFFA
jgi:hypothetical protein